jgi:hypothetical protein
LHDIKHVPFSPAIVHGKGDEESSIVQEKGMHVFRWEEKEVNKVSTTSVCMPSSSTSSCTTSKTSIRTTSSSPVRDKKKVLLSKKMPSSSSICTLSTCAVEKVKIVKEKYIDVDDLRFFESYDLPSYAPSEVFDESRVLATTF